jgi:MFS family permease
MGTSQGGLEPLPVVKPSADVDQDVPNKRAVRKGFRPVFLDATNFLLSDVRGALGPYLNVFLVSQQHWSQSSVGVVTMIGGLLGLAAQVPIGMAIDATRWKRAIVVASIAILAVGATVIFAAPSFWPVLVANTLMAVVGDIFAPAIAAITLGLYTRQTLARRTGRNAAFDHAGNVAIAFVAAGVGYYFSQRAVFLLVPLFASLAAASILAIPADAIDHARARGADPLPGANAGAAVEEASPEIFKPTGWVALAKMRSLTIFAVCCLLFQFANAPLLPLVGQKLAAANPDWATALTSACIIAAQAVMMPVAMLVGWKADVWGRRPLFLIAFAVLPVRAVLYTLSDHTSWLLGVQLLDGVGAGLFSALTPLLMADIARGTGRYNMALGAVIMMQGIGGSLSGLAAGFIVDQSGYNAAFLTLAVVAAIGFAMFFLFVPETLALSGVERPVRAKRVAAPVDSYTNPPKG